MKRCFVLLLLCCAASANAGTYAFYYWSTGGVDTAFFTEADLSNISIFSTTDYQHLTVCGGPDNDFHWTFWGKYGINVGGCAYVRRGSYCIVGPRVLELMNDPTRYWCCNCRCSGEAKFSMWPKMQLFDEGIVPRWYWDYPGEKSFVTDPETGDIVGINVVLPPDEPGKVAGENGDYVIGENGPKWEFYDGMDPGPTREMFAAGVDTIGGKLDVLHVDNTLSISELQDIESAINAIPPASVTVDPEIIVEPVINVAPPAVTVNPVIHVEPADVNPVIHVEPAAVTVDFPSEMQVDFGDESYAGYSDLIDLGGWSNLDADIYQTGVDTNFRSALISPSIASSDYNIVTGESFGDGNSFISGLGNGVAGAVETLVSGISAFLDPFKAIGKVDCMTVTIYNKPMVIDLSPFMAVINVIRAIAVLCVYYLSFCSVRSAVFMIFGGA